VSARAQVAEAFDFVEEYAAAAERFAAAVEETDLRSTVPACPDWTGYDVVAHLGNVHAWAATVVETGRSAAPSDDRPASRKSRAARDWYAGKAEDLYQVLRAADPDSPCWNFAYGAGVAGFWPRRQLHETLMHLVDLDQTAGRTTLLSPSIAADGVGEVLTVFLHRMHSRGNPADLHAPLSLVSTDTGHTWLLDPRPDGLPAVAVRATPAEDRLEAPAEVLLRLLWGRASIDDPAVSLHGEVDHLRAFLASRLTP
jgi:uncharacterized protein (TIGR03083 family)